MATGGAGHVWVRPGDATDRGHMTAIRTGGFYLKRDEERKVGGGSWQTLCWWCGEERKARERLRLEGYGTEERRLAKGSSSSSFSSHSSALIVDVAASIFNFLL